MRTTEVSIGHISQEVVDLSKSNYIGGASSHLVNDEEIEIPNVI